MNWNAMRRSASAGKSAPSRPTADSWSHSPANREPHPPARGRSTSAAKRIRFFARIELILLLRIAAGEDARHVVEHVGRAGLVVAEVLDQSLLHDVDLLLGFVVDDAADQVLQLDRVALVFEELKLQRLEQPRVGVVFELLAVERQGADVIHDLLAEI